MRCCARGSRKASTPPLDSSHDRSIFPAANRRRRPHLLRPGVGAVTHPNDGKKGVASVFVIRLLAALIGWFFGFYLGASLLEVSNVTPVSNQVLVVLLLAAACAILGWLGAPYVTVAPARVIARWIRGTSAGDLVGAGFGAAFGLMLGLFLAFPLSFLPGNVGRYAPLITAIILGVAGAAAGSIKRADLGALVSEMRQGNRDRVGEERALLDTSVIIDGRVADVVKAGFIRGTL